MTWPVLRLADVLAESLANGKSVPTQAGGFPVLRLTALSGGRIDLRERKGGAWSEQDAARFLVREGDFLISRGNGSLALVGRGGLVLEPPGPVAYPDTMIRARPDPAIISSKYLSFVWESASVRAQIESAAKTTAGIYKVNQQNLGSVKFPVPPLEDQQRIVAHLTDRIARLEGGESNLRACSERIVALRKATLQTLIPDRLNYPDRWVASTVGQAGHIELGRQRHPDWHTGSNMRPYLRVANVFEDRIDSSDIKEMHWPPETFERFRLHSGDVLLNEGQSPELLGRPAIYRGEPPEVGFTNTLLRFKPHDSVLSDFALLVFRRHMHSGRFAQEVRITTNIGHLSIARLKPIEFPIPPLDAQAALVDEARERLDAIEKLKLAITTSKVRARALYRSLLSCAFTSVEVYGDARSSVVDGPVET